MKQFEVATFLLDFARSAQSDTPEGKLLAKEHLKRILLDEPIEDLHPAIASGAKSIFAPRELQGAQEARNATFFTGAGLSATGGALLGRGPYGTAVGVVLVGLGAALSNEGAKVSDRRPPTSDEVLLAAADVSLSTLFEEYQHTTTLESIVDDPEAGALLSQQGIVLDASREQHIGALPITLQSDAERINEALGKLSRDRQEEFLAKYAEKTIAATAKEVLQRIDEREALKKQKAQGQQAAANVASLEQDRRNTVSLRAKRELEGGMFLAAFLARNSFKDPLAARKISTAFNAYIQLDSMVGLAATGSLGPVGLIAGVVSAISAFSSSSTSDSSAQLANMINQRFDHLEEIIGRIDQKLDAWFDVVTSNQKILVGQLHKIVGTLATNRREALVRLDAIQGRLDDFFDYETSSDAEKQRNRLKGAVNAIMDEYYDAPENQRREIIEDNLREISDYATATSLLPEFTANHVDEWSSADMKSQLEGLKRLEGKVGLLRPTIAFATRLNFRASHNPVEWAEASLSFIQGLTLFPGDSIMPHPVRLRRLEKIERAGRGVQDVIGAALSERCIHALEGALFSRIDELEAALTNRYNALLARHNINSVPFLEDINAINTRVRYKYAALSPDGKFTDTPVYEKREWPDWVSRLAWGLDAWGRKPPELAPAKYEEHGKITWYGREQLDLPDPTGFALLEQAQAEGLIELKRVCGNSDVARAAPGIYRRDRKFIIKFLEGSHPDIKGLVIGKDSQVPGVVPERCVKGEGGALFEAKVLVKPSETRIEYQVHGWEGDFGLLMQGVQLHWKFVPYRIGPYRIETLTDFFRMVGTELNHYRERLRSDVRQEFREAVQNNEDGLVADIETLSRVLLYLAGLSHWCRTGDLTAATWLAKRTETLYATRQELTEGISGDFLTLPYERYRKAHGRELDSPPPAVAIAEYRRRLKEQLDALRIPLEGRHARLRLVDLVLEQVGGYRALSIVRESAG